MFRDVDTVEYCTAVEPIRVGESCIRDIHTCAFLNEIYNSECIVSDDDDHDKDEEVFERLENRVSLTSPPSLRLMRIAAVLAAVRRFPDRKILDRLLNSVIDSKRYVSVIA